MIDIKSYLYWPSAVVKFVMAIYCLLFMLSNWCFKYTSYAYNYVYFYDCILYQMIMSVYHCLSIHLSVWSLFYFITLMRLLIWVKFRSSLWHSYTTSLTENITSLKWRSFWMSYECMIENNFYFRNFLKCFLGIRIFVVI